jgi:ABC-2 type transport system permease protein
MRPFDAIKLVAAREITMRGKDKSFVISTLITLGVIVVVILINLAASGDETHTVGYVGDEGRTVAEFIEASSGAVDVEVELESFDDQAVAKAALADGEVAGVITKDSLVFNEESPGQLETLAQSAYADAQVQEELRAQGLSDQEIAQALSPEPLEVQFLDPPDPNQEQNGTVAFIGVLLLYGQIIGYGYWVASGVVEEKATRVVELLLSTIRPRELLAGKVIGIGLLGLVQLVVIGAVGLAMALVTGVLDIPGTAIMTLLNMLLWFVLGYIFYACLFAVSGAIAARQEDLQSTTAPLSMVLLAALFGGIFVTNSPDSVLGTVGTLVPFTAPLILPVRIATGDVAAWQIVAALLITFGSGVMLIRLAGRLYSGAILRTGGTVKLKEAWASASS